MAFCKNCGNQVNDGTKFCPKCGQVIDGAPQQQVYQQPAQAYQQPLQQRPYKPDSHMVLAILTTIFCCLPLGIVAILQANKVDKFYHMGEYDEANAASQSAKKWSIIGIIVGFISICLSLLYYFLVLAVAVSEAS